MQQSKGFVLFYVLIMLQVFSLISLYSITTATNNIKANHHLWQGITLKLKSAELLQKLEMNIQTVATHCSINTTVDIAKKDKAWWQINACHDKVNDIPYYYLVGLLGDDPCAVMGNNMVARYYRITLYLSEYRYQLQSTIALPVLKTLACQQKIHTVMQGRQGWREIL